MSPLALVVPLLFASGFCALVYETIWARSFRELIGSTTRANAVVLAVFLGCAGLGAWVVGSHVDRARRPLAIFAIIEAGIALTVLASIPLAAASKGLYLALGGASSLGTAAAAALHLACAAVTFGASAFLMGGSLPAAACAISSRADPSRTENALAYAANTLGAASGVVACTFHLMERVGSRGTLMACCAVNGSIAALAYTCREWTANRSDTSAVHSSLETELHAQAVTKPAYLYVLAAGFSFAFFAMELVWFRCLSPLLGGTTFAFGIVLATVTVGIAAGGASYKLVVRRFRPESSMLAYTAAGLALAVGLPFAAGDRFAIWLARNQIGTPDFSQQMLSWIAVAALAVLPAAVFSGLQFPLFVALAGRGRESVGKHVGFTYAATTIGSVAGLLHGGLVLLPAFGINVVWQSMTIVIALLACAVAVLPDRSRSRSAATLVPIACAAMAACCALRPGPTVVWRHSGIGSGRFDGPVGWSVNDVRNWTHEQHRRVVHEDEGTNSMVAIVATDSLSLVIDGRSDGNAIHDAGTQIGLGILASLIHPAPESAFVIGAGTGQTCGWLAAVQGVESVTVVEIEPAVMQMVQQCAPVNHDMLSNDRVNVVIGDAREVMQTQNATYDVIIAEPSNPHRHGIAALYTADFYRDVSSRLRSGGLFMQWLQAYEIEFESVLMVAATLRSAFPSIELWRTTQSDLVFVCATDAARACAIDAIKRRISDPVVREGLLHAWQARDVEGVVARYVGGNALIDELIRVAAQRRLDVNTDDRNRLEFAFAKTLGREHGHAVQALLEVSKQEGDDVPRWALGEIDAPRLWRRRIAAAAAFGDLERLEIPDNESLQRLRQAMLEYARADYSSASRTFATLVRDPGCPIVLRAEAHSVAESTGELAPELAEALAETSATDAECALAIASWRKNLPTARDDSWSALELLARDPWSERRLVVRSIDVAVQIGLNDRDFARRCVARMRDPFAMRRYDDLRLLARYDLASTLELEERVEAVEAFEPFVPWNKIFLADRADAYSRTDHPLRRRARADFARFIEHDR